MVWLGRGGYDVICFAQWWQEKDPTRLLVLDVVAVALYKLANLGLRFRVGS